MMNWMNFFGRFHPLLVHLPIGILIIACLFDWLSYHKSFKKLKRSVSLALFVGVLSALLSCVSGYLLSQSGEYDAAIVGKHQWLGILTLTVSFFYWQVKLKKSSEVVSKIFIVVTLILLSATGHLGGSLTHGENYLTESLMQENRTIDFASVDLSKAIYYTDLVQPILSNHCYTCHGETKQKGKLRLDQTDFILKGGDKGKTIVARHPDESEMINRLLLPLYEKNHMPPKEKPQLTAIEIEILKRWIELGADFKKSVTQLNAVPSLQRILALKSERDPELEHDVAPADEKILGQLKKYNLVIQPIAEGNHHLHINLVNAQHLDSVMALLPELQEQIVSLRASSPKITDAHLSAIGQLKKLRKLDLSHTAISTIELLKNLNQLQSLNLSFTNVDKIGIKTVSDLATLQELFLYQTKITEADVIDLRKKCPKITFELGEYFVPTLPSDTTIVKPPKNSK